MESHPELLGRRSFSTSVNATNSREVIFINESQDDPTISLPGTIEGVYISKASTSFRESQSDLTTSDPHPLANVEEVYISRASISSGKTYLSN